MKLQVTVAFAVLALSCGKTPPPVEPQLEEPVLCEDQGQRYQGFGDTSIPADRLPGYEGYDLKRLKPYSALEAEFRRALGTVPTELSKSATVFGAPPERWHTEAFFTAVSLYDFFRLSFDACEQHLATNPPGSLEHVAVRDRCAAWADALFERTGTEAEVALCTDAIETVAEDEADPTKRWAYGCAALASSPGFLSF